MTYGNALNMMDLPRDFDPDRKLTEEAIQELPTSFRHMIVSEFRDLWLISMAAKLQPFHDRKAFQFVHKSAIPKDSLFLRTKWIYSAKQTIDESTREKKYKPKSQLVILEHTQIQGVHFNNNWASVVRPDTVGLLFSLIKSHNWNVHQMGVTRGNVDG